MLLLEDEALGCVFIGRACQKKLFFKFKLLLLSLLFKSVLRSSY